MWGLDGSKAVGFGDKWWNKMDDAKQELSVIPWVYV